MALSDKAKRLWVLFAETRSVGAPENHWYHTHDPAMDELIDEGIIVLNSVIGSAAGGMTRYRFTEKGKASCLMLR